MIKQYPQYPEFDNKYEHYWREENHNSEKITINNKEVEIDCFMADFIVWLNNLRSVETLFCCEGDRLNNPYVQLVCKDDEDLRFIFSKIQPELIDETFDSIQKMFPDFSFCKRDKYSFAECEVKMDETSKKYFIKFHDKDNLMKFNEFMGFKYCF